MKKSRRKGKTYRVLSTRMGESLGLCQSVGDGGRRGVCFEDCVSRAGVHHGCSLCGNLCSRNGLHRSVLDETGLGEIGNVKHASDGSCGGCGSGTSFDYVVGGGRNESSIGAGGSNTLLLSSSENTSHSCETETRAVYDIGTAVDASRDHLEVAGRG